MNRIDLDSPILRDKELAYEELVYSINSREFLPQPNHEITTPFFEVINKRRSRRNFRAISLEKLNILLWYSARTIEIASPVHGTRWEHRPSPSAGGRHPIDIFIIDIKEAKITIYLYQNIPHALAHINVNNNKLLNFLVETEKILPRQDATILWLGAQFDRTLSRYQNGESLVWKDAGILISTIFFVAEALEINCCPIGITGEPCFSQLFQTTKVKGVGGIYIGEP